MKPHHSGVVDKLVKRFESDESFLALMIGGSIARGWERDDSDVDFILIASNEGFEKRKTARSFHYYATDLCDYPGGYVDGKILDLQFLEDVANRGSEVARSAFVGVQVAYSRLKGLDEILGRITIYPEEDRLEKIRSFFAHMRAYQWYVGEAEKLKNDYLMSRSVNELILYGGRMILAYNRIFFPFHKWFLRTLKDAPEKPSDLLDRIDELLARPSKDNADKFCESIAGFRDWETSAEGWPARFMEDTEWAWRRGQAPVSDW